MIAAFDVQYGQTSSSVACVTFLDWRDPAPLHELQFTLPGAPAAYVPGEFWKRELPCLTEALLRLLPRQPDILVVDGYVWLDHGDQHPGLGAYAHQAFALPVVGVAKTAFNGSGWAKPVFRGTSTRPLYVTAVGVGSEDAARWVQSMAGPYRVPDLLKRVDHLCRWGTN